MTSRRYLQLAVVLSLGLIVFFGATLRRGHNWDGDYGLYMLQARNIATGHEYRDTGFIANPANPIHPALYPPMLPLLLAPMYRLEGPDVERMRWLDIVALGIWLLLFAHIAREFLSHGNALALATLTALHPYFWELKNTLFSEEPFLAFCYAALLFSQRLLTNESPPEGRARVDWPLALLVGLCIASACLTRVAGVVLIPALLIAAVFRARRFHLPAFVAVVTAVLLMFLVGRLLPSDSATYMNLFADFSFPGMLRTFDSYLDALPWMLQTGVLAHPSLQRLIIWLFMGVALYAFVQELREGITIYALFLAGYTAMLLAFPVATEMKRYSLPLWPLLLLYGMRGVQLVAAHLGSNWPARMVTGALTAFALVTLHGYSKLNYGPIPHSVTSPTARQMFMAVRDDVPSDGLVLARKPTLIALYAQRRSAVWPEPFSDKAFWTYARESGASYLLQDYGHFDAGVEDHIDGFVIAQAEHLTLVFHNEWFSLWLLRPPTD